MKENLPSGRHFIKDELIHPRPAFNEKNFKSLLQQHNLKATTQRLSILKTLSSGAKTHLTAREIFEKISRTHPDIGFATVYRFLKVITKLGITSELRMSNTPSRYELKSTTDHYHLTCIECGQIVEFQNKKFEDLIQNVIKKSKFSLDHHIIELYGKCQRCGQKIGK